ncbi:MAG: DMT family transporter [Chloroflexi bacterium]|nr:DMT family transporter [Chloroflexota bacterium]
MGVKRLSTPETPALKANDRPALVTGALFAFTAAIAYGAAQVLTRYGVADLAPPLVGSAVALFWGTLGFSLFSVRSLSTGGSEYRRGCVYFAAAGIFSALGVIALFQSLELGPVVLVAPVVSTNPLFTLLWAVLLLREVERITLQILLGSLLVVGGVIVLTVA